MTQANQVAISPDGRNAYVTGYGASAISILDRNPQTGALHRKPGRSGCVANYRQDGCETGRALGDARGVAVSPDGTAVYVASQDSRALVVFDRDPQTGALHQKPGKAGCISALARERSCERGPAIGYAVGVTVAPTARVSTSCPTRGGRGTDLQGHGDGLLPRPGERGGEPAGRHRRLRLARRVRRRLPTPIRRSTRRVRSR